MLEALPSKHQLPLPCMAQPWEAGEEGFVHSREAPGYPRAGPSWRTCWAAAHTMPYRRVRAEPTHTLWEHSGPVDAAIPQPRGKERTGISATTLPDASPLCRVGGGAEREPPLGSCTLLSHLGSWTSGSGRLCTEVSSVFVFARTWANFSKKAENIYRFEVETQTGKAL